MKKYIFLLLTAMSTISTCFSQTKNYISIEAGPTISNMGNHIKENMKKNGFGDHIDYNFFFFFFSIDGSTDYPVQHTDNSGVRLRYGYNIKPNAAIEAGFGISYDSETRGADASGNNVNYLTINARLLTAYAAYMWKNDKGNAGIGVGPAASFLSVKQESPTESILLSKKNYILPGAIVTGYVNVINRKHWFLALRSELVFNAPAKTKDVSIVNNTDKSFVSVSKGTNMGGAMGSCTLAGGFKF